VVDYYVDKSITAEKFIDVLRRSSLADRRPINRPERIGAMLRHADCLISAWQDDLLIGVARSVTDFSYCCYLSDLAVDREFQRQGIGRELIRKTRQQLGPDCMIILLAAPDARQYYPHIGFRAHDSAWILTPGLNLD